MLSTSPNLHQTHTNTALTTEELAAYVRPELLHDVKIHIDADLLTPFAHSVPEASVSGRVVEI